MQPEGPRPAILQEPSPDDCIMRGTMKEMTGGDTWTFDESKMKEFTGDNDSFYGRSLKISEDDVFTFKAILTYNDVSNIPSDDPAVYRKR